MLGGFQFETTTNSPLVTRNTTPLREENPPSRPQTGSQNRPAVRRLTVSQTRLALDWKERRAAEQGPGGGEGRAGLIGQQVFVLDAPRQYDERRRTTWKGQQPSSLSFPLLVSRISWPISSRLEKKRVSLTIPFTPTHTITRRTKLKTSDESTYERLSRYTSRQLPLPPTPELACSIRFLIGCRTIGPVKL